MRRSGRTSESDLRRLLLESLFVGVVLYALFQGLTRAVQMSVFAARDLARARQLAAGRVLFFGPEMCGGGHLPGPFYYVLLAAAVKIKNGWEACWRLELLLMSAGGALAWFFARRRFGVLSACLTVGCMMTSRPLLQTMCQFTNASFIPGFAVLALVLLAGAFDGEEKNRGRAWLAYCAACGLGAQIHFSLLSLFVPGLILQSASGRLKLAPLRRKDFLFGLGLFAAAVLPYLLWLAAKRLGAVWGQPDLPFTGGDLLPWRGLRERLTGAAGQDAVGHLRRLLIFIPGWCWAVVLLSAAARRARALSASVKVFAVAAFVALLPALIPLLTLQYTSTRYASCFVVAVGMLLGALAAAPGDAPQKAAGAAFVALAAVQLAADNPLRSWPAPERIAEALACGALLALFVRNGRARASFAAAGAAAAVPLLVLLACHTVRTFYTDKGFLITEAPAMRQIRAQTGWSYAEASRRIYYADWHGEASSSVAYEENPPARGTAVPASGLERIDGYFVGYPEDVPLKDWPLGHIDPFLESGIRGGGIRLGRFSAYGDLLVVPYEVVDAAHFPAFFHNVSEGYSRHTVEPLPSVPGSETFRAAFNDSPGKNPLYEIDADVRLTPAARGEWNVRVVLSGEPLSQSSFWLIPDHIERLQRPYLAYDCGQGEKKVVLAERLGGLDPNEPVLAMLAPYERDFRVSCPGPRRVVAVGYESADVLTYRESSPRRIPGSRSPGRAFPAAAR